MKLATRSFLLMAITLLYVGESAMAPAPPAKCKFGSGCKSLKGGKPCKYTHPCKHGAGCWHQHNPTHYHKWNHPAPAVDYKALGKAHALDTATTHYTGAAIKANAPRTTGEVATNWKISAVKQFSFKKAGFTLRDALAFTDTDFQNYFMASYRTFANKHAPNHIWFDFKPIKNGADLGRTDNIEWVLVAHNQVHDFAPTGSKAPGGFKYGAFVTDAKAKGFFHKDLANEHGLAGQKCCTRRAFGIVTKGTKNTVHNCGRMVYPCDIGQAGVTGLKDLSGKNHGARCLNMANFFRQSTDGDVCRLMQELFGLAKTKVKAGTKDVHIYSYGGSRPWLHLRCEPESYTDLHYLWY